MSIMKGWRRLVSWLKFKLSYSLRHPVFNKFVVSTFFIILATWFALPNTLTIPVQAVGKALTSPFSLEVTNQLPTKLTLYKVTFDLNSYGIPLTNNLELKKGLDIVGGTQVTLAADMTSIPEDQRVTALESAKEILRRRIDLFGIAEPQLRTAVWQDQYRILIELPGLDQPEAALQLIGQTAQLQFREYQPQAEENDEATPSALAILSDFQPTDLTGELLQRADVQFDQTTGQPVVALQFSTEGAEKFADLTANNIGQPLGIFLDNMPLTLPVVNEAIYGGQASIQGDFQIEEAKTLAAQLNAGALPVSIKVLQQNTIGPSLGQESLDLSLRAGIIGLAFVAIFMITIYGWMGVAAVIGLIAYGILTITIYKLLPVTVTLPGIAGLMLSIGMAVDANILSFERIKDELRHGQNKSIALKRGYEQSWTAIKDANLATLAICFILFNPLNWGWLNTSGPIRGFALTLAVGVILSLFTGVFYSRLLLQLFWQKTQAASKSK